jgi:hypothetical protein
LLLEAIFVTKQFSAHAQQDPVIHCSARRLKIPGPWTDLKFVTERGVILSGSADLIAFYSMEIKGDLNTM